MKNKILSRSRFITLLRTAERNLHSEVEKEQFEHASKQFIASIERIVRNAHSKIEILRMLAYAQRLLRCAETLCLPTQPELHDCIEQVRTYLDAEKEITILQAQYPALCEERAERPKSPLYWSKDFTPTDLVELLAALHLAGAFCKVDGSRAEWALIVETFAKTVNVRVNNPDQCRHAVLNRKLRLTRFLDLLRGKLIEKSEE